MVHTSEKAQKKEIPVSPARSRVSAFASKFFDKRVENKLEAARKEAGITRRNALKQLATALGLGVVVAIAPNALSQEKRSPPELTGAASKEVEYEVFTDPKELEPYFKNAEGKFVRLQPGESTRVGEYEVWLVNEDMGYVVEIAEGPEKGNRHGIALASSLGNINVLAIDVPEDNPYIKGTMLVFADAGNVYFQYFNKKENRHELRGVPLWSGHMRGGPIRTGYEITENGIEVINIPGVGLVKGDKFTLAYLDNDGVSGGNFFDYQGPDTVSGTKEVAMR